MSKKFGIVMIILALAVAGFVWLRKIKKDAMPNDRQVNQNQKNEHEQWNQDNKDEKASADTKYIMGIIDEQSSETVNVDQFNYNEWMVYYNEEKGFEIMYPPDWVFQESGQLILFGTPESRSGGFIWGLDFSLTPEKLEDSISDIGKQFVNRKQKRKRMKLNSFNSINVTTTTEQLINWKSETVYISKGKTLYKINNGAIEDEKFRQFYSSFRFIEEKS